MKNREVIEKIKAYHPPFPADYDGCDDYKIGNPEEECTGVGTAIVATPEIIRKAAEEGINLLVVHEPTFYATEDYPDWRGGYTNEVYEEKVRLLEETGITIWRDHDHMHAHKPDSIFTGVIKYLGWEKYQVPNVLDAGLCYTFDFDDMTVEKMCDELKKKMNLNGLRYMGNPKDKIRKVAFVAHLFPDVINTSYLNEDGICTEYAMSVIHMMESGVDAIIPGEVIDWTVLSYIRDALQQKKIKAMFNVGHFNWEELGMKYAAEWIGELVGDEVLVRFIEAGDMYRYY